MKKTLMTLALIAAANTGYAHDEAGCQEISNLLARLSCYDESHGGVTSKVSSEREDVQASRAQCSPHFDTRSSPGTVVSYDVTR